MWTECFQEIKSNNSDLSHEAEGDEEKNKLADGENTKTGEKGFSATDDAEDNLEEVITTGCQTRLYLIFKLSS